MTVTSLLPNPKKDKRVSITINGANPSGVDIRLDTGESLGLIQSLKIDGRVGHLTKVSLESILEKSEIDILQKNTEIKVVIPPYYYIGYWINRVFSKIIK
jgi:hypothetical protein